jgi:hypothetical protein
MSGHPWSFDLRHDRQAADEFAAFGYIPYRDGLGDPLELLQAWSREPLALGYRSAARRGVPAWRAAVRAAGTAAPAGARHVVMLSGGKDSRAILAALLQDYSPHEIVAATFGVPGELDHDIACHVARAAGVEHVVLDTRRAPWGVEELVTSIVVQGPPYPFPYPFGQRFLGYELRRQIGPDHVYWDGLCGESVGSPPQPRTSGARVDLMDLGWDEAMSRWLDHNLVDGWQDRVGPTFRPEDSLPQLPFLDKGLMSYWDQLNFGIRQRRRTATRVVPGYRILTPFLAAPWLDLMLGVDRRYRADARLYRDTLVRLDKKLFAIPIARNGSPVVADGAVRAWARDLRTSVRTRVDHAMGCYAVSTAGANGTIRRLIREPGPVRDVVESCLSDLSRRTGVAAIPDARGMRLDSCQQREAVDLYVSYELNLKALEALSLRPATPG